MMTERNQLRRNRIVAVALALTVTFVFLFVCLLLTDASGCTHETPFISGTGDASATRIPCMAAT